MAVLPRHYIIGIVIFTFMIIGGVSLISIVKTADSTFASDDKFIQFNKTFNKYNELNSSIVSLQSSITEASTDFGIFGVLNALINSGWAAFKLMFSSLAFFADILMGMTTIFGIPAWIPGLLIMLTTILLVFAIFSAIFQKDI